MYRVTTSDNEWQRMTASGTTCDNQWQRVAISAKFYFFRIREEPTTKHMKENLKRTLKRTLKKDLLN